MDGANDNCDEEKENEEEVADIVPGVEVEEDAGTIQFPEESRPVNFHRLICYLFCSKCQLTYFWATFTRQDVTTM